MQLHSVWPTSTSKKQPSAHPVFHRLWSVGAFVRVTRENVRRFTSAPGLNVLFAADDPSVRKETLDLAALAPDLAATFEDALNAAGFTDFTDGRMIAGTFGIYRLPAVLLFIDGRYIGAVEGLQTWDGYRNAFVRLLTETVQNRKTIVIRSI